MSYATLYAIIALWAFTILLAFLSCITCGCWCCPRNFNRFLRILTVLLIFASVIVTAFFTHRLQALANGTYTVARTSVELAEFLVEHARQ